jgi:hypothetical protein
VQIQKTFVPNAAHRALYDERFEVFQEIYRRMKGIHKRLNYERLSQAGPPPIEQHATQHPGNP